MTTDTPNPQASPHEHTPRRETLGRRVEDVRNASLAGLIAVIPDAVLCINRSWQITYANAESRRISGIFDEHLYGRTLWEILPRIAGTEIERTIRSTMESGKPAQVEYFSSALDLWLEIHLLPTEDGVAVLYRDITDRKGAELLRDTATRQLRQVLDTTSDAVITLNREMNFTFLNRRAREILAVKGDLTGKNLWDEFPFARDHGQYHASIADALNKGIVSDFEEFYPAPLNMLLAIQVHPSDDGVVLFFRDITARRKADLDLRRAPRRDLGLAEGRRGDQGEAEEEQRQSPGVPRRNDTMIHHDERSSR